MKQKTTPISRKLREIKIGDEHADGIRRADLVRVRTKIALGEIAVAMAALETRNLEALTDASRAEDEYLDAVRKAALAHGVDPDGEPSNGRWHLDTNSMTLRRLPKGE
jgi:hypothetical protein